MNDDVVILNENGKWYGGERFEKESDFKKLTQNMKLIHIIEAYEKTFFFQDGANFIKVDYNDIHKNYHVCNYVANDDGMPTLMNHFFKTA